MGGAHDQLERAVEVPQRAPPVHLHRGVDQGEHQLGGIRAQQRNAVEPRDPHDRDLPCDLLARRRAGRLQSGAGVLRGVRPDNHDAG